MSLSELHCGTANVDAILKQLVEGLLISLGSSNSSPMLHLPIQFTLVVSIFSADGLVSTDQYYFIFPLLQRSIFFFFHSEYSSDFCTAFSFEPRLRKKTHFLFKTHSARRRNLIFFSINRSKKYDKFQAFFMNIKEEFTRFCLCKIVCAFLKINFTSRKL